MQRRRSIAVAAVAAGLVLAGCGASASKFSGAAEDYIEGEEVAAWGKQTAFTNAICTEPVDTARNTEFQCTADGSDEHSYVFQVVISGERTFRIESLQPQN